MDSQGSREMAVTHRHEVNECIPFHFDQPTVRSFGQTKLNLEMSVTVGMQKSFIASSNSFM